MRVITILVLFHALISFSLSERNESWVEKKPTILIVTLVRNKAHTLPLFLSFLEDLEYPKDRMSLW
jgi:collagen beta-1,O-galactosyltransferase